MPPTTRRGESPNGGNDLPTPQSFRELMAKVNRLQQTITTQQTLIDNLKKSAENARQDNPVAEDAPTQSTSDSNILRSLKAPPIPIFSGKSDERTTTKVRGFIYNVRKTGKLTNLTEEKLVELAECHLQDKAAAWIMRLEQNDAKPTTIDDLQTMMISEFVPHDERARAKARLMNMELKTSIETHIEKFQDLIEICATPISEAYIYFFMSLPAVYKEESRSASLTNPQIYRKLTIMPAHSVVQNSGPKQIPSRRVENGTAQLDRTLNQERKIIRKFPGDQRRKGRENSTALKTDAVNVA